jgi:CheY-like chemotaxis protein
MKIMIIDDSRVISKRLEELLTDLDGINIVCLAEDGLQAIEEFSKTKPDLIILDLMIPQMNGLDVLRNIRQKSDSVVIIILTNYNQSYFKDLCASLGADYFLDKSAEFELVHQICFNILNPDSEQNTDYLLLNGKKTL